MCTSCSFKEHTKYQNSTHCGVKFVKRDIGVILPLSDLTTQIKSHSNASCWHYEEVETYLHQKKLHNFIAKPKSYTLSFLIQKVTHEIKSVVLSKHL